jgi:glucans biosynthesis protein
LTAAASAAARHKPFDYAWLKGQAHKLAGNAYQGSQGCAAAGHGEAQLRSISVAALSPDHAQWADAGLAFRLQFFHVGRSFSEPVRLYEWSTDSPREIVYDPSMFEFDKSGIDPKLMRGPRRLRRVSSAVRDGLAGRRRSLPGSQLLSRGGQRHAAIRIVGTRLAVDTAFPRPEEFPRFTHSGSSGRRRIRGL